MKAVLDANVVISAAYTFEIPESKIAHIFRSGIRGRYKFVTSDHIMVEVEAALSKPFFIDRLNPNVIKQVLDDFRREVNKVELTQHVHGVATYWQDDVVLSTALSGGVDYLVTGDRELLDLDHHYAFRIVHPNAFLVILNEESGAEQFP